MISSKTTIMMPTFNICNVFKLLLLAFALAIFPFTCEAKIYLLSVGISNYPGTKNDLRLPHNDAATMQWLYKENQQAKVCLLMNDKAKVATVKKALQKMVSIATADDIVVMFFSGHGIKGGFVCYDGFLYYSDISIQQWLRARAKTRWCLLMLVSLGLCVKVKATPMQVQIVIIPTT